LFALFAAAAVAAASPDPSALSPAEAMIRNMTTRTILSSPARYCKEPARAQAAAVPAPLRCRPAPYYVSARDGRRIPHILVENHKGPPMELLDRQGRPCHLMRSPADSDRRLRVAD
jgi:hypothetical protein